ELVNVNVLGSYIQNPYYTGGGYDCRFAPSNSSIFYVILGGTPSNMFVSQDGGAALTQCTGLTNFSAGSNSRATPPYVKTLTVHPTDPSQGYFQLLNGVTYHFTSYGATITAVSSAPIPTATG